MGADQTAAPGTSAVPGADGQHDGGPGLTRLAAELSEYVGYYLDVQRDRLRHGGRQVLRELQLRAVLMLITAGTILLALTFLGLGLVHLFTVASGGQLWVGYLVTGLLLAAGTALTWWGVSRAAAARARRRTVQKYEQRQRHQRARFGHDIASRAAAARERQHD